MLKVKRNNSNLEDKHVKVKNSNKKTFLQLVIMIGLTLITQVVTILKTSTVAAQFGATVEMDAFSFSNSIGTFIFSFIGAGITTVLIPNLVKEDKEEGINIFISILYTLAFAILIIVYFSRKFIVQSLSNGGEQFVYIACNVMLITLITQYISSFLGATNAIFQCSGKFNFPKFVNLATTIILVMMIVLLPNLTIYKYSFYILLTSMVNVIIQVFLSIKGGYKFRYNLNLKNSDFKDMFKVFLPTVLSSGLYQFSLVTDTIISSNLGEGKVAVLSYSNTLMTMVNAILISNLMVYFYPKIARSINDEDSQDKLFELMILLSSIIFLVVAGFFIVGRDGIVILYERGKFTSTITKMVYYGTLLYMIGIPINTMRDLVYRYFYAKGDTITPFKNSLIISILNILISIILSKFMGIYGIILGTVLTSYLSFSMILFRFNKKFTIKYSKKILCMEIFKIILTTIIVIFLLKIIMNILPEFSSLLNVILYGVITVIIYFVILILLKSKILKIKL